MSDEKRLLEAELEYHERLYSGFAQKHFAKPAVRALREHMVARICRLTGAGASSRVLSLGCGIGDTELLLAPKVNEIVGVDLSPKAVRQASADAARLGASNAHFIEGTISAVAGAFDVVIAIFFLHHLADKELADVPSRLRTMLKPGVRRGCGARTRARLASLDDAPRRPSASARDSGIRNRAARMPAEAGHTALRRTGQ
jgi:cyclopropane fatty-acyl-phospholipid synthase-like methyltransferase